MTAQPTSNQDNTNSLSINVSQKPSSTATVTKYASPSSKSVPSNLASLITSSSLQNCIIPSWLFRTHTLYQGGKELSGPPTISSTLSCTNLKFCKVLKMPFKVSENRRLVKNTLYGYHGNCLITWCFSLIIVKMIMKTRQFWNASRNHKFQGVIKNFL